MAKVKTKTTGKALTWLLRRMDANEAWAEVSIAAGEREAAERECGPAFAQVEIQRSMWSRRDLLRLATLFRSVASSSWETPRLRITSGLGTDLIWLR